MARGVAHHEIASSAPCVEHSRRGDGRESGSPVVGSPECQYRQSVLRRQRAVECVPGYSPALDDEAGPSQTWGVLPAEQQIEAAAVPVGFYYERALPRATAAQAQRRRKRGGTRTSAGTDDHDDATAARRCGDGFTEDANERVLVRG